MCPDELLEALVSSLREEGDALVAGDTESLRAIVQRKSNLLTRLAPQLRQVGHGDSALDHTQLRQALLLNNSNGRLLSARMLANGTRLDVLARVTRGETLYGADGGISTAAGPASARATA